ncbi:MAG: NAD(P)-binding protein, partial [Roseburia sp.]|nr:NAD(P)-binding protein [Roseburia sp.]
MDLTGKKVLVVGSGISGVAAAELLKKKGNEILLVDGNKELDVEALKKKALVFSDVEIILGELKDEDLEKVDLAVFSPGVPTDIPMAEQIREKNIPIWGEIELAYYFAKGPVAAITGTNGKTTTTALTGEIMANY